MSTFAPWKTGAALALTMAISYLVCTVLHAVWPDAGVVFLNALFHGLDFRQLGTPQPPSLAMVWPPLLVLGGWGFVVGTLFSWLLQKLTKSMPSK